jgi:F-type H+-transporting ATPase subunit epsilon
MAFQCVIVTPEQQVFQGEITQAIIPAADGLMGILTGHAPLLAKVSVGPLQGDLVAGISEFFLVDGGVAQMKGNELTIVTDDAQTSGAIDVEAARAAFAAAEARIALDPKSIEARQHEMKKAKAAIALAGKE